MGLTKGRRRRRRIHDENKKTKRYKGGELTHERAEELNTFTGPDAALAIKYAERENRKGSLELPTGNVFLVAGIIGLISAVVILPIMLKA